MAERSIVLEYFNQKKGTEVVRIMAKLSEEYGELLDAFATGSREDFIDELADLNGVVFHIAGIMGLTQEAMIDMVYEKCRGREKDPDYKRKHPHNAELSKLRNQLKVLREIEGVYPTSSIGNIIMQIESRIKNIEK